MSKIIKLNKGLDIKLEGQPTRMPFRRSILKV